MSLKLFFKIASIGLVCQYIVLIIWFPLLLYLNCLFIGEVRAIATDASFLFNSRTAIAGAIIGLLFVFLRLEEEYWRSPFLITLVGLNFEAGNGARENFCSGFSLEQNWKVERKESGFLFTPLFSREREIEVWKKNSVSERNFVFTCGFLKPFLFIFWFRRLIMILR